MNIKLPRHFLDIFLAATALVLAVGWYTDHQAREAEYQALQRRREWYEKWEYYLHRHFQQQSKPYWEQQERLDSMRQELIRKPTK